MQRALLSVFASQMGMKEKTLKRKFGDCIYRIGRQSFIDVDAFDKVFAERSQKGRQKPRKITESTSIKRIQMHIPKAQVKLQHFEIIVTDKENALKAAKDDQNKRVAKIELNRAKKEYRDQESLISKLLSRIEELLDLETKKWLALEKVSEAGAAPRQQ